MYQESVEPGIAVVASPAVKSQPFLDDENNSNAYDIPTTAAATTIPKPVAHRRPKKPKDKPRRPLSAYNLFFAQQREIILDNKNKGIVMDDYDDSTQPIFQALAKCIGARWKLLQEDDKKPFLSKAAEELTDYRQRLEIYESNQKLQPQGKEQQPQVQVRILQDLANTRSSVNKRKRGQDDNYDYAVYGASHKAGHDATSWASAAAWNYHYHAYYSSTGYYPHLATTTSNNENGLENNSVSYSYLNPYHHPYYYHQYCEQQQQQQHGAFPPVQYDATASFSEGNTSSTFSSYDHQQQYHSHYHPYYQQQLAVASSSGVQQEPLQKETPSNRCYYHNHQRPDFSYYDGKHYPTEQQKKYADYGHDVAARGGAASWAADDSFTSWMQQLEALPTAMMTPPRTQSLRVSPDHLQGTLLPKKADSASSMVAI